MKKYLSLFLCAVLIIGLLSACGGSSKAYHAVREEAAAEAPAMMAANDKLTSGAEPASTAIPENRKWIITVYLSAETEDLDTMTAALDEHIKALDGYVINSISGDESLTFKGSRQTVEFPGLPEKTITAPIVVLYSKADTGTN